MKTRRQLVVDGHALAFYCWYTNEPPSVTNDFLRIVELAIERNKCDDVVVAFDPPPPVFRHDLWPTYKAGRPPVPEGFLDDCDSVKSQLTQENILFGSIPEYEADDVIGSIASVNESRNVKSVIYTVDMDLLQLVSKLTEVETFSQYHGLRKFDLGAVKRRYNGLTPDKIPDFKALVGDKSDNLPGIPGIGEQTAAELFEGNNTLEDIYSDVDKIPNMGFRGAKRAQSLLIEHREQAFLMRRLMTIVKTLNVQHFTP